MTLSASPTTVAPGGTVTATWSGITAPTTTDWIGLYTPGAPNGSDIDWIYVSCSKTPVSARASGSCPLLCPPLLPPAPTSCVSWPTTASLSLLRVITLRLPWEEAAQAHYNLVQLHTLWRRMAAMPRSRSRAREGARARSEYVRYR